jgi:uncharacterized protein YecT (DUF1311 family)
VRLGRILGRKTVQLLSLLVFSASVWPTSAQAQITPREADQELNTSYRAAMQELPASTKEKLRIAQRAWLAFAEKNRAAMRLAAPTLGISSARCEELAVMEVEKRAVDFVYSKESNGPEETKGHYQRVDADLNAVYERCLATLSPEAKTALREAQRAWVAYRDANRPFGLEFLAGLTVRRADQLSDFYVESTTAPLSMGPSKKAEPSPPDPFERAR